MAEMNSNNQGGFTPRQGEFSPRTKGGKKRRVNKDGVLTLLFIALIAIIVVVLIIFLVKAIVGSGNPANTTAPEQTASTPAESTSSTGGSQATEPTTEQTSGQNPGGYATIQLSSSAMLRGPLVVVDGSHQYVTPAGNDNTLTSLYNQPGFKTTYRLKNSHIALRYEIIESFSAMLDTLKATFASSSLSEDYLLITGAGTVNDPSATIDYTDENSSGYSFDIRVYITSSGKNRRLNSDEQAWLAANCQKYGFVLRYEEGKEGVTGVIADLYHFRYVGIPHSTYMKASNLCLEEYVTLLKNYSYESPLSITSGAKKYDVYYVKATGELTAAYVPSGSVYTVSGNNSDGFIITVEK